MSQSGEEQTICNQCEEPIKLFERDSKCCDNTICSDCLQFSDSCEGCKASLCEDCQNLECQACQEQGDGTKMCSKCRRECIFCRRDYCSEHLIEHLVQMAPCGVCKKQPCLDKKHPKESFAFVLACAECAVEATKESRKRKRFYASVYENVTNVKKATKNSD